MLIYVNISLMIRKMREFKFDKILFGATFFLILAWCTTSATAFQKNAIPLGTSSKPVKGFINDQSSDPFIDFSEPFQLVKSNIKERQVGKRHDLNKMMLHPDRYRFDFGIPQRLSVRTLNSIRSVFSFSPPNKAPPL